jgi:hypothetical protein
VTDWLLVLGTIFGINLLPAFGPPTWAVLVFFRLNSELPAVPLVLLGALAAASGRFVLATTARHLRGRFSPKRRENLQAAEKVLIGSRAKALAVGAHRTSVTVALRKLTDHGRIAREGRRWVLLGTQPPEIRDTARALATRG